MHHLKTYSPFQSDSNKLQFFFLDTDAEEERRGEGGLQTSGLSTGMTMLMRAMQPETFEAGVMLMEQVMPNKNDETNVEIARRFGAERTLKN